MKVAVLSPVAWRTPPRHYGPWEQIAYNVADGLVQKGIEVTLFATGDSESSGKLSAIVPIGYEEDRQVDAKVAECMHISALMERAEDFDLIHNHFDFLPLTYSRLITTPMVTTIHGFSSPKIIPVYKRYNDLNHYVSISDADRSAELQYTATVYNGLNPAAFAFQDKRIHDHLLFFGRFHPDKGAWEAIQIARESHRKIIMAGIIQDEAYFQQKIAPAVDNKQVCYIGHAGPERRSELLGNAYALLHPIQFAEPFGMSVAESMMCGTPVIAFDKGSMRELILDGETGFLVHSVAEAAQKVPLVEKLDRGRCRSWALSQFSQERMTNDYLKVYDKVISTKQ